MKVSTKRLCGILKINYKASPKIKFVKDRPGHDRRYALDSNKLKNNFGWKAKTSIDEGLYKTVIWYTKNKLYFRAFKKNDIVNRLVLK